MSDSNIVYRAASHEEIREKLTTTTFNSIRKALPDRAIHDACRDVGHHFRWRLLPPVVVVLHMVVAALWPEESFNACWQVIWSHMHSLLPSMRREPPKSGALSNARKRLPLAMWRRLFEWLSEQVQALADPVADWRGHRVVLIDGTTVSMADTPELHEAFGASTTGGGKRGKFPLARLVTVAMANTMTVVDYALGRYDDSEIALAWQALDALRPGDLVIGDRNFAAAHYYVRYMNRGLEFITRMNAGVKVKKLRHKIRLGPDEWRVRLPVNRHAVHADPSMPDWVEVRLVRVKIKVRTQGGKSRKQTLWLVTSLLDPVAYPAAEIAELYRRRWRIETLLGQVKVNLSTDVLRSKSPEGVRKEVAARLMAVNIVRSIMLEAALAEGVDPLRIGFVSAVRILLAFAPRMATANPGELPDIYAAMLREIVAYRIDWRPGRNEPRMVKREVKHYPSLKITRSEYKKNVA